MNSTSPTGINFNSPMISANNTPSGSMGSQVMKLHASKKRLSDKKTCRWVLDNGTICGRTFSKFDSLRRHVQELHKGVRPFVCHMCEKSYGRRDYLDRHMKSHTAGGSLVDTSGASDDHDNDVKLAISGSDDATLNEVVTVVSADDDLTV